MLQFEVSGIVLLRSSHFVPLVMPVTGQGEKIRQPFMEPEI